MSKAAEEAIDLAEGGLDPDRAVAKAAALYRLPTRFAHHVAHAFNVGQAARVRAAGADAWGKAASYPVADPAKVAAILADPSGSAVKPAAGGDYSAPPPADAPPPPAPDMAKLAAALGLDPEPETAKAASAPPAPKPAPGPTRFDVKAALARTADRARPVARGLAPAAYAGAKAAALAFYPSSAPLFAALDRDGVVAKRASAPPDPAVGRSHPLVKLAAEFATHAAEWAALHPTPPPPPLLKRAAPPGQSPADQGRQDQNGGKPAGGGGLLKSLGKGWRMGNGSYLGEMADTAIGRGAEQPAELLRQERLRVQKDLAGKEMEQDIKRPLEDTQGAADRVAEQDHVNRLLVDPRFAKADPQQLLDAYRELKALVPTAMANPAVSRHAINLRLQTGPLSLYDLGTLANLEDKLVNSAKNREAMG